MVYGMNGTVNGYRVSGNSTINPDENVMDDDWYRKSILMERKGGFVITGVREIKQFNGASFPAIIGSRLLMDDDYHPLTIHRHVHFPGFHFRKSSALWSSRAYK